MLRTLAQRPRLTAALAGLAYAVLLALAFPPFEAWPAAFVALVPLIVAARVEGSRPRTLGAFAALGALPFWLFQQHWTISVTAAGYLPLCLYLGVYPGLFVWLLARLARARVSYFAMHAALLWAGLEMLRAEVVWHGYAWYLVGQPLIDSPAAAASASAWGMYGVGAAVIAANACIAAMLIRVQWRRAGGAILFATALLVLTVSLAAPKPRVIGRATLAAVQTNVPQSNKTGWRPEEQVEEWKRLEEWTREAAARSPRPVLIAWPETMKPGLSLDEESVRVQREVGLAYQVRAPDGSGPPMPTTWFADRLLELQAEIGVPLLVGEDAFEGFRYESGLNGGLAFDARYNSAFLVSGGTLDPRRYDKVRLTPFGEYMPYIRAWPWLQERLLAIGAQGMSFDLGRGRGAVQFPIRFVGGETTFVTPICFEVTEPHYIRRLVHDGGRAGVIVNITNDGWFGASDAGREMHLLLARWRCAELATPMLRAANTGVSCAIDASGRVTHRGVGGGKGARVGGVLVAEVELTAGETLFARFGFAFGWVLLALGAIPGWALVRSARPKAAHGGEAKPQT